MFLCPTFQILEFGDPFVRSTQIQPFAPSFSLITGQAHLLPFLEALLS